MAWSSESRHVRGYGNDWVKLRLRILARDCYLCQCEECAKLPVPKVATQVDHIKPKAQGGTDDEANLRAVNKDCHQRITIEQQGKRVKRGVGVDGWPL